MPRAEINVKEFLLKETFSSDTVSSDFNENEITELNISKWHKLYQETQIFRNENIEKIKKWASLVQSSKGNIDVPHGTQIRFYDTSSINRFLSRNIENILQQDNSGYTRELKKIKSLLPAFLKEFNSYKESLAELLGEDGDVKTFTIKINEIYENVSGSGKAIPGYNSGQLKYHTDQVEKFDNQFGIKNVVKKIKDLYAEQDLLRKISSLGNLSYLEVINLSKSVDWFKSFLTSVENSLSTTEVSFTEIEEVKKNIQQELSNAKKILGEAK